MADFTHASAWCGVVYVAFVVDIYSRAIVGWAAGEGRDAALPEEGTLVIGSDDNVDEREVTQFLAYAVRGCPASR